MKLTILQNSDVIEKKNGFRIRTQRPKIIQKQVVLFQDNLRKVNFVDLCGYYLHISMRKYQKLHSFHFAQGGKVRDLDNSNQQ